MSHMKDLWENIHYCLDTYRGPKNWKSCQEIADDLGCPVQFVNEIVEQRWEEMIGGVETV